MVLRMIQNVPEQGGARTGGVNLVLFTLAKMLLGKLKAELECSNS